MITFIKKLIAVPIRMLAEIVGLVRILNPLLLWQTSWKLSHNPQDGGKLIVLTCRKYGIEAARQTAEEMLAQVKSCALASAIGSLEYVCHNVEAVNKWVKMARNGNYEKPEMLLHLELLLSNILEEYDTKIVIEQVLSRNDLPMIVTLTALIVKANDLLEKRSWDKAEEIAEHILNIQEQPDARLIKWVTCSRRGEQTEADEHFAMAQGKLSNAVLAPLVAQGWLHMGDVGKAVEWLYKAGDPGFHIKQSKSQIGELARSEEFQNYCREKESQ